LTEALLLCLHELPTPRRRERAARDLCVLRWWSDGGRGGHGGGGAAAVPGCVVCLLARGGVGVLLCTVVEGWRKELLPAVTPVWRGMRRWVGQKGGDLTWDLTLFWVRVRIERERRGYMESPPA